MILYDQIGAGISPDPHTQSRGTSRAPTVALSGPGKVWGRPSGRGIGGSFGGVNAFGGTWINPGGDGSSFDDNSSTDGSADNQTNSIKLVSNEAPRDFKRIVKAQTKIYSKEYRVSRDGESNPSDFVDIDRIERLMFYFTEHPEKARPAGFTPSHTTFFHLSFALSRDDREVEIVP
jgi:hypothetical protein